MRPGVQSRGRRGEALPVSDGNIRAAARQAIEPFENNGYPFAQAILAAELLNDSTVNFAITIDPGKLITYDSLIIRSKNPFNRNYFSQYLYIKSGRTYSERNLRRIPRLVNDLAFVKLQRMPEVIFSEGRADVYLFLEDQRANRFDGIVGFQPDVETGRPVLTGDLSLALENALRRGEQIEFQWRRLQEQTQNLKLSGSLPYLVNTRLGVWGGVELYRRDSTFTTSDLDIAVGYLLGADRYLRTFAERWSSNALRQGLTSIDNVAIRRYGLAWQFFQNDNRINPMRGYFRTAEVGAGQKELTTVTDEPETSRHAQYSGTLRGSFWIPVAGRFSVIARVNGGFKADSTLRLNEFYRIGGLNTLRGFDEEAIFARNFAIGTLEVKYLLDRTSAFFLFYDQGWYDRTDAGYFSDTPSGFGVGALIGTENSTFRIYYALGREQNNPILVRNGKVHFGFINRF
jgi:outer membrane protein assembly factor BamA